MGRALLTPSILILLLLLTPLTGLVNADDADSLAPVEKGEWFEVSPSGKMPVALRESSGLLHLTSGSFDPLVESHPTLAAGLDKHSSSVAILQLWSRDAMALVELSEEYDFRVLDHLPDEGWVVRMRDISGLESLLMESEVRWASPMHIGWRLHESLLNEMDVEDVDIVLAPDLSDEEIRGFEQFLQSVGIDKAWCGTDQCATSGMYYSPAWTIKRIAMSDAVLQIAPSYASIPLNSYAADVVGLDEVLGTWSSDLDGTGEVIGISDTGIDPYHPDIDDNILSIRTQYGLDSSSLDTNTGHGTHVVGTIVGNGSGDSEARGLAPEGMVHFMALEHDITGFFGRQGSLHNLLKDFYTSGARTGSNSWGAPGAQGEYTSDSRSVDSFAAENEDFTILFAAGESTSGVAAPSTAKNVLSIGASTSNRPSSLPAGQVWNMSASGNSADGRIKPDLVAPGVEICSTMSEEANSPLGSACGSGTHPDGGALYHSSNGSSHSTAVAAASVMLTREFLREEAKINAPSADLVRAALINGARDLGAADVPNPQEGWGQIDLENTFHPHDGSTALKSFYDTNISLSPGFGFVYGFDFDASHGISITLVWTDSEGSSSASQSTSRLVSDLDLILVAPDGTTWLGNDFAQGFSTTTGAVDSLNVVERVELPPGTVDQSGTWSIQVAHRGGNDQSFALVVTADGSHDPASDLSVFSESIRPSSTEPLVNEVMSIGFSWINQAPLATGSYRVTMTDVSTGEVLSDLRRISTAGGVIESATLIHTFITTGQHLLRLEVDVDDEVAELNDGNTGFNNNVKEISINVSALGVRLIPLLPDGSEPSTPEQIHSALQYSLDARTMNGLDVSLLLRHEGTGEEMVVITAFSVRMIDPDNPTRTISSPDVWSDSLNISSPVSMKPAGEDGDELALTLSLVDEDADPTAQTPRYAYAGKYMIDIEAKYQLQPLVKHRIRINITVEEVDDVAVAIAGTTGLEAQPGQTASFTISARNMGNNPAVYRVDCQSDQRWLIELGDGTSSSQVFEPLGLLEYLSMQVRVRVPDAVDGEPAAGGSDMINCWVTSLDDESLNYSIEVEVGVGDLERFDTLMTNPDGDGIGASALANEYSVNASEQYSHDLHIYNTGNKELTLNVAIQTTVNWPVQLTFGDDSDENQLEVVIEAGESATVNITSAVPMTASEGDSNNLVVSTWIKGTNKNLGERNSSNLIVRKQVSMEFECLSNYEGQGSEDAFMQATIGESASMNCTIINTGNAQLSLTWASAVGPDESWEMGFAGAPDTLGPYEEIQILFLAKRIATAETGADFQLQLRVTAEHGNQSVSQVLVIAVSEAPSAYAEMEFKGEDGFDLLEYQVGDTAELVFKVTNMGNQESTWAPRISLKDVEGDDVDGWDLGCSEESLLIGSLQETEFTCTVIPSEDADRGVLTLSVWLQKDASTGHVGASPAIQFETSVARLAEDGGLFAGLSTQSTGIIIAVVSLVGVVLAIRMRRLGKEIDDGEQLVAPGSHISQENLDQRREDALDIGYKTNEMASGSVSSEEVAAALAQSVPILPPPGPAPIPGELPKGLPPLPGVLPSGLPPPLPLPTPEPAAAPAPSPTNAPPAEAFGAPPVPAGGLPAGWTMEQWQHYGAEWLKRQG